MKTLSIFVVSLLGASGVYGQAPDTGAPPSTTYVAGEIGPHSREWLRIESTTNDQGQVSQSTNRAYVELCTGLMHRDATGNWVESTEQIKILPSGGAAATNAQHQTFFPANIYEGAIDLVMPDGSAHLRFRPLGLGFFDGNNAVLISELTNSIGQLLPSGNCVVYTNAFTDGIVATLRYTFTRAGLEQDLILESQLPGPKEYPGVGLDPAKTRLQLLTEFFDPPQPECFPMQLPPQGGVSLIDESLDFGIMKVGTGHAFLTGIESPLSEAMIAKQWLQLDGQRQFLIEEIPLAAIEPELSTLPQISQTAESNRSGRVASKRLVLPQPRIVKGAPESRITRTAQAHSGARGLVLDFTISGNVTNFTFRGDTTYYLSAASPVYLAGNCCFEGGTVLKFATNASIFWGVGVATPTVTWRASEYRPVILTAQDDNSVGESITNSTGSPTGGNYANPALDISAISPGPTISHFRITYARQAVKTAGTAPRFQHGQIVSCQNGFTCTGGSGTGILLRNVLFANVQTNFNNLLQCSYDVQNATVSSSSNLTSIQNFEGNSVQLYFTNCILVDVISNQSVFTNAGSYDISGNTNGFYNSQPFGAVTFTNAAYPFQPVGAGDYYLADGCEFRNKGTTNIDADLLSGLRRTTTYPPLVYSNITVSIDTTLDPQAQRDTDQPDLGYHYDPIDYLIYRFAVTNTSTLTISKGTAIAYYGTSVSAAMLLQDDSSIISVGTPLNPNWFAAYQYVQEQPESIGGSSQSSYLLSSYHVNPAAPNGLFQFSRFACPGNGSYFLYDAVSTALLTYNELTVQDCEFWNGKADFSGSTNTSVTLKNNLFYRTRFNANGSSSPNSSLSLSNSLFFGISGNGALKIQQPAGGVWYAFNNDFDTCGISSSTCTNGYNAYINCTNRISPAGTNDLVLSNALLYVSGPLGNFYQPTNSSLIDTGSVTANFAGLYHYTVTTNLLNDQQIKETNSIVDIGYHYVAVDSDGNPLDADGDSMSDYLEDSSGNGGVDSGETDWQDASDLGLKVIITRPSNNSVIP